MTTARVRFKTGDCDCSSLVKRCLVSCGLMDESTYMWTGNEIQLLENRQYAAVNLWRPERGDILWRDGHTEVYLGGGLCGGARIDENGKIVGTTKGDQTGREVAKSAYDPSSWERCMRYVGSQTVGGIPIPEAVAQLVEHAIEHDASHGYSQPNREGDGGWEWVTLTYDGSGRPTRPQLDVDGWLGSQSVMAWQTQLDTTVDGIVSGQSWGLHDWYPNLVAVQYDNGGSRLVRAVQRRVGAPVDGVLGPVTIRRLQRWLGENGYFVGLVDGVIGPNTAKAVQRSLNDGAWS